MLAKQSRQRVKTGELNRLVRRALDHNPPPRTTHHPPKVYYATQVSTEPPTIVLICNNPAGFSPAYRRYLLGVLRDQLSFGEVPIKLYLHRRRDNDDPGQLNLVNEKTWLICKEADCDRKYPVRSHIPVMLINEGDKWIQTPVQDLPHPDTLSD